MNSSLQSKIATAMWGMTVLSILAASVLTGLLLIRSHRESIRSQLEASAASLISLGISNFSALNDFEDLNLFIEDALQMENVDKVVRIYGDDGRLLFSNAGVDYDPLPEHLNVLREKPIFLTLDGRQRKYESLVVPYLGKKKTAYYLQVIIPLPRYSQIFRTLWWQDLLLLTLLIAVSLVVSRRLTGRLLHPVAVIATHLQEMDPQHIERWKPLDLQAQGLYLGEIIRGVNLLTQRTRSALTQLRKMSRYVAHELRTPLTILQGEAETVLLKPEASREQYADVLRSSLEEIQRMSDTVATVLQVSDSGKKGGLFHPQEFDLGRWMGENLPRWQKAIGRRLEYHDKNQSPIRVKTDAKLLYYLIDNLVRNVRDHTPDSGQCRLTLERKGGQVEIQLEDEGPGLPEELLQSLARSEASERMGIGLTLCRQIVEICGWTLRFSNLPERGVRVRIGIF